MESSSRINAPPPPPPPLPVVEPPVSLLRFLWSLPARMLIGMARLYQLAISPLLQSLLGAQCRFTPSCSEYFIGAVRKHGAIRGSIKGAWRVCRCNPCARGGYDPP